jgi:DNA-binding response OmpR family regulator
MAMMTYTDVSQLPQTTILAVEDEIRAQRLLRLNLEPVGYHIITTASAHDVLGLIAKHQPDVIVLDLKLADGDGFEVCRQVRGTSSVPIIILSAFDQPMDKVRGFELGADDYVTKPYDPTELAARIEAILRRSRARRREFTFMSGALAVYFEQCLVTLNGNHVSLSRTEYRLLAYLAVNAGHVVTMDALLTHVWGQKHQGEYGLLHLYINRLRRKLHDNLHSIIVTKPRVGYILPLSDPERAVG